MSAEITILNEIATQKPLSEVNEGEQFSLNCATPTFEMVDKKNIKGHFKIKTIATEVVEFIPSHQHSVIVHVFPDFAKKK